MERLTDLLLRHRRAVVVAWLLLTVASFVALPSATSAFSEEFSASGEGFETNQRIEQLYGNGGQAATAVPVVTLPEGTTVDSPGVQAELESAFERIERAFPEVRVVSYATTGDRGFVSADGRTTYGLVFPRPGGFGGSEDLDTVEEALGGATVAGVPVQVTGIEALEAGGEEDDGPALLVEVLAGGVGALVVLAFVFGSLLALVPLLMAAVSIPVTFLALWPIASVTDVSIIVQFLLALIGLGVAIDYALLVVVRWREERAAGHENAEAVKRAMRTAGSTVVFSGTTVAIGLLAMLALPIPTLRSIGYGGLLIPLVSVAVAVTLLPVLLATIGPRVDWPRRKRVRSGENGVWFRWARLIVRRRWLAGAVAVGVLLGLAVPALSIQLGGARAESLAHSGPARAAFDGLERAGIGAGPLTPFEVLAPVAESESVVSQLAAVEGVHAVVAPAGWQRGGEQLIAVVPSVDGNSSEGRDLLDRLREATPAGVTIGGQPAQNADFVDDVYASAPLMIGILIVLTFILLARALRSLLLPLKAVVLNLLSLAASLGVMVLVWQEGYGSEAIWGIEGTGAVEAWLPIMLFAFLYGLSMDYEVFILARMREERDRGASTNEAVIRGLGHTGRLVTSAALILFLAFAALASSPGTLVKMFATSLAVGILLDATVVRGLLVPAAVSLMGRWNWWLPAWAARLLRTTPSPLQERAADREGRGHSPRRPTLETEPEET